VQFARRVFSSHHSFAFTIETIVSNSRFCAARGPADARCYQRQHLRNALRPSGAAISGAALKLVNTGLQTTCQVTSDKQGFYSFPNLPVGHYELTISADGFTTQRKTNLTVDTDSALRVDATLAVGGRADNITVTITVTSDPGVQVGTSTTHLGEVLSSAQMTSLPLNGRSYTDLLAQGAAYIHFAAKLRHHGGRYRRHRSFG
jgi:hypothetical protein